MNKLLLPTFLGFFILSGCTQELSSESIDGDAYQTAKDIAVRIEGQNPGSGFIVSSDSDNLFVLTASHVVSRKDEYDIHIPGGKINRITPDEYDERVQKLDDVDLAIIKLDADGSYKVPEMRTDGVAETSVLYVAGFPGSTNSDDLEITEGLTVSNDLAAEPLTQGYGLIYSNDTLPGMSGGPVLDEFGRVVGIHGRAEQIQTASGWEKTGYNLGIPVWTYRELITSSLNIRLTTPERYKIIREFTDEVSSKSNPGCVPPKNVRYTSMELTAPGNGTSILLEGDITSTKTCRGEGVSAQVPSRTKGISIVTRNGQNSKSVEYPYERLLSPDYSDSASVWVAPVSFSPDGQYLIIDEYISYGATEPGTGLSIINLKQENDVASIYPCPDSNTEYAEGRVFNGFVSSNQVSFTCQMAVKGQGLGGGAFTLESIFNLDTMTISSADKNGVRKEDYPSYGTITSPYKVTVEGEP